MEEKKSILKLLQGIFGIISYTPPEYLQKFLKNLKFNTKTGEKRRPLAALGRGIVKIRKLLIILVILAVLGGAGFIGIQWYLDSLPDPFVVTFRGSSPNHKVLPGDSIETLALNFLQSAAQLEDIGKDVSEHLTIEPEIPGSWVWDDEKTLRFTPRSDWGIAASYKVTINPALLPEHMELEKQEYEFTTRKFNISRGETEFYIDPQDSSIKRILATFRFNYPVDRQSLESRISVKPDITRDSGSLRAEEHGYQISYDEEGLTCYIVSDPVGMPTDNKEMVVTIDQGVQSRYGGNSAAKLISKATVPGMSNFIRINSVQHTLVRNSEQKYDQIVVIDTKGTIDIETLTKYIEFWELPQDRPPLPGLERSRNHRWRHLDEVTDKVLEQATRLTPAAIPGEQEFNSINSFQFSGQPGRYLYLKIKRGAPFYGGYVLNTDYETITQIREYPKVLEIMSEGSLLTMAGDRQLSLLTQGIAGVKFNIGRIIPEDLNHLISQSNGDMTNLRFQNYRFDEDNITEQYSEFKWISSDGPNDIEYVSFNFNNYLQTIPEKGLRYGLFILEAVATDANRRSMNISDKRLIVVSDLGILVKHNLNNTKELFVQSLSTGLPASGVKISVIGKNGIPLVTRTTGADGKVQLPDLNSYSNEQYPTAYVAQKGNDLSFLPYSGRGRWLDYSSFDVGGVHGISDPTKITSYLFSDRGIYRPGDQMNIGMILKAGDWSRNLRGTTLKAVIRDPRGNDVLEQKITASAAGFEELNYKTETFSPTGEYQVYLYLVNERNNTFLLGTTTVKVEEFLPDRLKLVTKFSTQPARGWVSPEGLTGQVDLKNLYGTPAVGNTLRGSLNLRPTRPYFYQYREYRFMNPFEQGRSQSINLGETTTDDEGKAEFNLNLENYDPSTWQLSMTVNAFEKGSGRSVTGQASVLVSPLDYMIGVKADGSTSYITKGAERNLNIIAVNNRLEQTTVQEELLLTIREKKYVSTLVKQPNGVYKYQSVPKEIILQERQISVPDRGLNYRLPTTDAGEFIVEISDSSEKVLNTLSYSVAGRENLSRSLDRNAELEIKLSTSDVEPGQEIEVFIKAPYAGAGLITVEREKVYAHKWFKTTSTSTVQRITIPADLEGNGYISVAFLRGIDSPEIYMSPLSYGTVPFSVSKAARTNEIILDYPQEAKPGEPFTIKYRTSQPGKIVIFAVDEGILQVAKYNTPDPLAHFFRKRALEVKTSQILDQLLPEFDIVRNVAAMGGGGGYDAINENLNPFQRRQLEPVAYWSGILDASATEREVSYDVPDYFNGTLRVMAVAVSQETLGATADHALLRNDFIISPNTPMFSAPGDNFKVTAIVANNKENSGESAEVTVSLNGGEHFEITPSEQKVIIPENRDAVIEFQVQAKQQLGAAELLFSAEHEDTAIDFSQPISIRPLTPYRSQLTTGTLGKKDVQVPTDRSLYDEFSKREVFVSYKPAALASGLFYYLWEYPHGCTEQLISAAFPALYPDVIGDYDLDRSNLTNNAYRLVRILQARQKPNGSIGMWTSRSDSSNFVDVYALHYLTEARKAGYIVPQGLMDRLFGALKVQAGKRSTNLYDIRNRSYAIYVLTLNEIVTTSYIEKLREDMEELDYDWRTDISGVLLAGAYSMLQQDSEAIRVLQKTGRALRTDRGINNFYTKLLITAQYMNVIATHQPSRLPEVSEHLLTNMISEVEQGHYNTLSSSFAIMALNAFTRAVPDVGGTNTVLSEIRGEDQQQIIALPEEASIIAEYSKLANALEIRNNLTQTLYYQVMEAGFDTVPAEEEIKNGMEVYREYLNSEGQPATSFTIGDEVTVVLKVRSTTGNTISDVALVDLLPAGMEADIETIRNSTGTWKAEYVDIREDRIILYGDANESVQDLRYTVRCINEGTFQVPPVFGEAMYDLSVWASRPGGSITIKGE